MQTVCLGTICVVRYIPKIRRKIHFPVFVFQSSLYFGWLFRYTWPESLEKTVSWVTVCMSTLAYYRVTLKKSLDISLYNKSSVMDHRLSLFEALSLIISPWLTPICGEMPLLVLMVFSSQTLLNSPGCLIAFSLPNTLKSPVWLFMERAAETVVCDWRSACHLSLYSVNKPEWGRSESMICTTLAWQPWWKKGTDLNLSLSAGFVYCTISRNKSCLLNGKCWLKVLCWVRSGLSLPLSVLLLVFSDFVMSVSSLSVCRISGGELFERIVDEDFELSEREVIKYMLQIIDGVQFIHKQGIVHLDLKPENIMCVNKTGSKIKLIDFGLARRLGTHPLSTLVKMCHLWW